MMMIRRFRFLAPALALTAFFFASGAREREAAAQQHPPATALPPPPPPAPDERGQGDRTPADRAPTEQGRPPRRGAAQAPTRTATDEPSNERASAPLPIALQLALGTGYSLPLGSATSAKDDALSKSFGGQVPLHAQIGVRIARQFYAGVYVGYGFGAVGTRLDSACSAARVDCSAHTFRAGLEGQYYFRLSDRIAPWVGAGIGIESTSALGTRGGTRIEEIYSGIELLRLSGGLDIKLSEAFAVGPVVDLAFGQYNHGRVQATPTSTFIASFDQDITSKGFHEWITLGVRVRFLP